MVLPTRGGDPHGGRRASALMHWAPLHAVCPKGGARRPQGWQNRYSLVGPLGHGDESFDDGEPVTITGNSRWDEEWRKDARRDCIWEPARKTPGARFPSGASLLCSTGAGACIAGTKTDGLESPIGSRVIEEGGEHPGPGAERYGAQEDRRAPMGEASLRV